MIELFNLCERKDEFGYVRKNGEIFEIYEKISNTKIYATENFCVLEKAGIVNSVAIKDSNVRFEKPAGIFKDKLSFLSEDKILIIDDFLANGSAALGLIELIKCAGAEVVGVGIVIEKAFQNGGEKLREDGINLHSLVRVAFDNEEIIFV